MNHSIGPWIANLVQVVIDIFNFNFETLSIVTGIYVFRDFTDLLLSPASKVLNNWFEVAT